LASIYALILSGKISAQDISLLSNQGINITGTVIADETINIDAKGPVQSLGVLSAKTLIERGASFSIGGIFTVGNAKFENKDGAAHFVANTLVSGNIRMEGLTPAGSS
jgi:hypothetical protein